MLVPAVLIAPEETASTPTVAQIPAPMVLVEITTRKAWEMAKWVEVERCRILKDVRKVRMY